MMCGLNQLMERKECEGMYLLWVSLIGDVRTLMMDEAHASRYLVNSGADKTYYDLKDMYDGHIWRRILLPIAICTLVWASEVVSSGFSIVKVRLDSKRSPKFTWEREDHMKASIEEDPRTFDKAMQSRDVAFWKEAINDEMDSIMENNTWILYVLPPGCNPLGCKWIFKRKMKVDGTIDKFKARLVIQGFRQKEGIDYFDTNAPVARISTIRLLIALAATYNLVIHQMDVKTTFLNGDLEDKVYMKKPEGFIMPGNEHKDIGEADVILGISIKREDKGITITQSHYIDKILKKFKCDNCCPVSTPLDPTIKLMPNTGRDVDQLEYSRAIGCLMYAMTSTRPDIAYVVGKLSRFPSLFEGYFDASWITNSEDHTSTTEFVALAAVGKEAKWLRNLIYEIPL
ncbi:zinc finger, CCHC-type containing protein [Tanacetum coccineum]